MATRHRPVSPRSSRPGLLSRVMVPLGVVGLLFVGLAIYTLVNGELRLPFGGGVVFAFQDRQQQPSGPTVPAGMVAVFAAPRDLPAFTEITRDHIWAGDGPFFVPVPEASIAANGLFRLDNENLARFRGRVLKRAKPAGYAFKESDFLPKGTRAGPSAGIPPGKRGIWINTVDVQGLTDARAGDSVDLVAAQTVEPPRKPPDNLLGNVVDPVMKARMDSLGDRQPADGGARSWVVARGATVITPMRSRALPTKGRRSGAPPETVEEVFLAMAPTDVAMFSQALAQDVKIIAAPRSGQPELWKTEIRDLEPVDQTEALRKMLLGGDTTEASFGMVEVIRGGDRETVTVPRAAKDEQGKR